MKPTGEEKSELKFNIGVAFVMRIDELLNRITHFRINDDFQQLIRYLRSLYLELEAKMDDKNRERYMELQEAIVSDLSKWQGCPSEFKKQASNKLHNSCEAMELFLRDILHRFDLLMPKNVDMDDDY